MSAGGPKKRRLLLRSSALAGCVVAIGLFGLEHHLASAPRGCASCHLMKRYVASALEGRDLDAAHLRAGVGCLECHTGYDFSFRAQTAIGWVVHPVEAARPRKFSDAMCTRCHASTGALAERTGLLARNPHSSHWPELSCTDCHAGHARQVDFCGQCHDNGGQRMTGDPPAMRVQRWDAQGQDQCLR